ncbi:MAG: patatin-like phospholipase family protein [Spirochaetes bacterium]|nr:patatin-like phospholipase family protein [Spirochaetota bacterium]
MKLSKTIFSQEEKLLIDNIAKIKKDKILRNYFPYFVYVLSGGAAKGFSHFGILKSLEMFGICPKIVVGSSSGAIVGALYSYYQDSETAFIHLLNFIRSKEYKLFSKKYFISKNSSKFYKLSSFIKRSFLFTKAILKSYFIDFDEVYSLYKILFNNIKYEDLKIRFYSCATDFIKGKPKLFGEGDLPLNVLASSAIPGIFPLVQVEDSYYVDGFVSGNLPLLPLKNKLQLDEKKYYFIVSDLSSPLLLKDYQKIDSFFDIILRTLDISIQNKSFVDRTYADFVFNPIHKDYDWDEFENYADFVKLGFESFKKSLYYFYKSVIYKIEEKLKDIKNPIEKYYSFLRLKKLTKL